MPIAEGLRRFDVTIFTYCPCLLSCELLSVCIFDILSTAPSFVSSIYTPLWIAFSLYLWYIEHSRCILSNKQDYVVNCFQFVSLIYWAQHNWRRSVFRFSCELLSVCIFDILSTASKPSRTAYFMLWIAFSLYLWYIEHSFFALSSSVKTVVNCFQFVSLIYWAQH